MKRLALVALLIVAGSACGDDSYRAADQLSPSAHLILVAHQDDDLIFMQPELGEAIAAGEALTTVYLTAGQARQGHQRAEARAEGVMAAYGAMVGSWRWSCGWITLQARPFWHCRHREAPISLLFLGLPDGGKLGELRGSLRKLWRGEVDLATTVARQPTSLARRELLDVLAEVLQTTQPASVDTLDFSSGHGRDHSDHLVTAAVAALAVMRAGSPAGRTIELRGHRGYNVADEPPNRDEPGLAEATRVLRYYRACADGCAPCGQPCRTIDPTHAIWLQRRYLTARRVLPARGQLALGASCLQLDGDGGAALGSCAGAPEWRLQGDSSVRAPDGRCLTALPTGEVVAAACASAAASAADPASVDGQRFLLDDEGQLLSALPGVPVGDSDPSDEANAPCLTALGGRAHVAPCPSTRPRWTLARVPVVTPLAQLGLAGRGRALQVATLRLEGKLVAPALCALEADGLRCAPGDGRGGFTASVLVQARASARPLRGDPQSLSFGDVDGDGAEDACASSPVGTHCVLAAEGFAEPQRWSPSDLALLRLIDIDGDGVADACGTSAGAVRCWRSTRDGFTSAPARQWSALAAPTWMGDVDGDGRAEWCAATPEGPSCAANRDPREAGPAQPWGYARNGQVQDSVTESAPLTAESVGLADATGDGTADWIVVRAGIVSVAHSTRAGFAPRTVLGALGGTALITGDLDGDGRADVCTTDALTLRCALTP